MLERPQWGAWPDLSEENLWKSILRSESLQWFSLKTIWGTQSSWGKEKDNDPTNCGREKKDTKNAWKPTLSSKQGDWECSDQRERWKNLERYEEK